MKKWYLYVVECSDGSLYTGITTNIERRINEHNYGDRGAKYTRSRRPVKLIYKERVIDRSIASKREYRIKRLKRSEKTLLIKD